MIPIYICDDDMTMLCSLRGEVELALLTEDYDMELAGAFSDPRVILRAVEDDGRQGIYLLDVDLKDETYNGFILATEIRKLDPRGFMIFYNTESWHLRPFATV